MCGRFSLTANEAELNLRFQLEGGDAPYVPRYNGAPTQMLAVITGENPHKLSYHRWGLIPPWAKDISFGNKMINARAETITEKSSFRAPLISKRCLVPADGFYEWQQNEGKQPLRIFVKDNPVFSMAGLWERWKSPEGIVVESFNIITTEANNFMKPIHSRMPVILNPEDEKTWLSGKDLAEILSLLKPYSSEKMDAFSVSKLVNSPKNDRPEVWVKAEI
ncbi:MAG: SOS response-associated peptidase [Bacteroidota bacterium]